MEGPQSLHKPWLIIEQGKCFQDPTQALTLVMIAQVVRFTPFIPLPNTLAFLSSQM